MKHTTHCERVIAITNLPSLRAKRSNPLGKRGLSLFAEVRNSFAFAKLKMSEKKVKIFKYNLYRHHFTFKLLQVLCYTFIMIFLLILFLAFVVFLAFLLGNNISNVCTFWLFKTYESLSVLSLVFISFACGIVFSIFVIILCRYFKGKSKSKDLMEIKNEKKKN